MLAKPGREPRPFELRGSICSTLPFKAVCVTALRGAHEILLITGSPWNLYKKGKLLSFMGNNSMES